MHAHTHVHARPREHPHRDTPTPAPTVTLTFTHTHPRPPTPTHLPTLQIPRTPTSTSSFQIFLVGKFSLCLTIRATLHLYILDIIDSVDSHQCVAQLFHNCQEKCVARWTQKHGKHGSGALLNPRDFVVWWSSGEQSISRPFVLSALVISECEVC